MTPPEPRPGVEPGVPPYQGGVLPLNYRGICAGRLCSGVSVLVQAAIASHCPGHPRARRLGPDLCASVEPMGIEPTAVCLQNSPGHQTSRPHGGVDGIRTHYLILAKDALSQLSYNPRSARACRVNTSESRLLQLVSYPALLERFSPRVSRIATGAEGGNRTRFLWRVGPALYQ